MWGVQRSAILLHFVYSLKTLNTCAAVVNTMKQVHCCSLDKSRQGVKDTDLLAVTKRSKGSCDSDGRSSQYKQY